MDGDGNKTLEDIADLPDRGNVSFWEVGLQHTIIRDPNDWTVHRGRTPLGFLRERDGRWETGSTNSRDRDRSYFDTWKQAVLHLIGDR